MAVAVAEPSTSIDYVTGAVLANYRARLDPAAEITLAEVMDPPKDVGTLRAVRCDATRTVEVVLDRESPIHAMAEVAWRLQRDAQQVVVLVSLDRLGEAHGELRGTPCTLQGWWFEDDDVHFTGFETP